MRDFDKSFRRAEMFIRVVWVLVAVMVIGIVVGVIVLTNAVTSNREGVGDFFGRIAKGFIEASR